MYSIILLRFFCLDWRQEARFAIEMYQVIKIHLFYCIYCYQHDKWRSYYCFINLNTWSFSLQINKTNVNTFVVVLQSNSDLMALLWWIWRFNVSNDWLGQPFRLGKIVIMWVFHCFWIKLWVMCCFEIKSIILTLKWSESDSLINPLIWYDY